MDTIDIPCGSCLAPNRVPAARVGDNPKCGRCKTALIGGHPVQLDDRSFAPYLEASDLPVVVDFWAAWCGPCRAMAPQFEAAARASVGRALFAKLDTDKAQATAARYAIRSIPTLIVFRGGEEIGRQSGAMSQQQVLGWLAPHLRR